MLPDVKGAERTLKESRILLHFAILHWLSSLFLARIWSAVALGLYLWFPYPLVFNIGLENDPNEELDANGRMPLALPRLCALLDTLHGCSFHLYTS